MMGIKPAFWLANVQEACERLAYFGIRAVLPLMMVSVGTGGLGLSMSQKGLIYGIWALIQCLVPMFSGGFSESFGYKKSLVIAFIINAFGYILMANISNISASIMGTEEIQALATCNFTLMMIAGCTIGLGTAIFKPPVQGTVAKSLNEKNSGLGFGIFYWVVNIGGFLAPMLASALRGSDAAPTWHYVFYGAAFVTIFNLLVTLVFFKEPVHENKDKKKESPFEVFLNTMGILFKDRAILGFLLIVSGFWLMFMQLWDLLPNFIDEWVDRRSVGSWLSNWSFFDSFLECDNSLKPEMIINIDSLTIILLVLPLSWVFSKFKMITALVLGMFISVIGFILSGMTMSGFICCIAVFVFAIGEIICSPKFNEYIGMTAPADKKAIYMGFSNMPFAIGWAVGNFLSGPLYDAFSSKKDIGLNWLAEHGVTTHSYADLNLSGAKDWLIENGADESKFPGKLDYLKNWLTEHGAEPNSLNTIHVDNLTNEQMSAIITQDKCGFADTACQSDAVRQMMEQASNAATCGRPYEPGLIDKFIDFIQSLFGISPDPTREFLVSQTDKFLNGQQLSATKELINQAANIPNDVPLQYFNTDVIHNLVQTTANLEDPYAATQLLWDYSHPWIIWIILGVIGVASMAGMIVFYFKSGMYEKDMAASNDNKESKETTEASEEKASESSESDKASEDKASESSESDKASEDKASESSGSGESSEDGEKGVSTDDVENVTIKD